MSKGEGGIHPFDRLVHRDEALLRLAEAAMLFASDHYPELATLQQLARLDGLAARVRAAASDGAADRIAALRRILVDEERLVGNEQDYYDPRNCFLNEVLERRLGIPISLSVIWLDVCEQLGWPAEGVGLPGHYIIRYFAPEGEILVDPYHGGRVVQRGECNATVSTIIGRDVQLSDNDFEGISKKLTLMRMLNNLRWIYIQRRAWPAAAMVIARLIALQPDSQALRRELLVMRLNASSNN